MLARLVVCVILKPNITWRITCYVLLCTLSVNELKVNAAKLDLPEVDFATVYNGMMEQLQGLTNQNADAHMTALKLKTQWMNDTNQAARCAPSLMNNTVYELPALASNSPVERYYLPAATTPIGEVMREVLVSMRTKRPNPNKTVKVSELKKMENASKTMVATGDDGGAARVSKEKDDTRHDLSHDNAMELAGAQVDTSHEDNEEIVTSTAQPEGTCILFYQEKDTDHLHEIVSRVALDGRPTDAYLDRVFWWLANGMSKDQYRTLVSNFIIKKKRAKRIAIEAQLRPELDTGARYKIHNKSHREALFDQHIKGEMRGLKQSKQLDVKELDAIVEQELHEAVQEACMLADFECDDTEALYIAGCIDQAYHAGHQGNDDDDEADDENVGGTKVEGKC